MAARVRRRFISRRTVVRAIKGDLGLNSY
uniref:Uncharacterized protein n=1 Tax=Lepeophtheirus salmonis TaxID=72036 RepID=A0A0K2TFX4_LEPSM